MRQVETIPLTKQQKEIMKEFYNINPTKVIFNKIQRKEIWDKATRHEDLDFDYLNKFVTCKE